MDDTVTRLPVKPRAAPGGLMLVPPPLERCGHHQSSFVVDADAGKCFCTQCNAEVSPMFVLKKLMHHESMWNRTREAYADEMKRLGERSKTKCQHCGKLTHISRR